MCLKCHSQLKDFQRFHEKCVSNETAWNKLCSGSEKALVTEVKAEFLDTEEDATKVLPDQSQNISSVKVENRKISDKKSQASKNSTTKEEDVRIKSFFDLSCTICLEKVQLNTFNELKGHLRKLHHAKNPGLCCCNRKFSKRSDLLDHIAYHLEPEKLSCHQCNTIYSNTHNLNVHMAQRHGSDDDRPYECDICCKRFVKIDGIRLHMPKHFSEETRDAMRTNVCNLCGVRFMGKHNLTAHIKRVHLNQGYFCDICAQFFKAKFEYDVHKRNVHGEAGPERVQCIPCNKWLSHAKSLKVHNRIVHGESITFVCKICGRHTSSRQGLNNHVVMRHAERTHKCEYCGKAFQTPARLKEHVSTHTGISLYSCRYCVRTFNSSSNMYKHLKGIHLEEWTRDKIDMNQNPAKWRRKMGSMVTSENR